MIGPYDLSGSLGIPGQLDHPQVVEAGKKVIDAATFHRNLWYGRIKIAESVYYADAGGKTKSYPHQLIAKESAGIFCQLQWQLNDGIS